MKIKDLTNIKHDKIKNILELKDEEIEKDEAHLVFQPTKKDSEFNIDIDVELKEVSNGIKAESSLLLLNLKTKKLFNKFKLIDKIIKNSYELKEYLDYLADTFEKFKSKNLNSIFDRNDFKTTWGSQKRKKILKKVISKIKLN